MYVRMYVCMYLSSYIPFMVQGVGVEWHRGGKPDCFAMVKRKSSAAPVSLCALKAESQRKGATWQSTLRNALRHDLDLSVAPVQQVNGQQEAMSVAAMETFYERRRLHMEGKRQAAQWAQLQQDSGKSLGTPRRAVFFWHNVDGIALRLPRCIVDGLLSCACNSGLSVHLITYQAFRNVPSCVQILDASKFLPLSKFKELERRQVPVQILADLVRARALASGFGGAYYLLMWHSMPSMAIRGHLRTHVRT